MEPRQFDALARSLTESRSRRGVLAAVVGGALGVAGFATTGAKKKKCPSCKKRKKGKCKGTLPDGAGCPDGTCQGGICVTTPGTCPGGCSTCETCVNGTCQSVTDGATCSQGTCRSGVCRCVSGGCPAACAYCAAEFPTGLKRCVARGGPDPCNLGANCEGNADCGPGMFCSSQNCDGFGDYGVCLPACTA